jgi:hypothetical protein
MPYKLKKIARGGSSGWRLHQAGRKNGLLPG